MLSKTFASSAAAIAGLGLLLLLCLGPHNYPDFWYSPDQQGDRLMRQQQYQPAAKVYVDPLRQGIAFYRAGDFKSAATAFSHVETPDAVFNRANALVMLGKYDDAVKSYDRALVLHPDWQDAQDNRAVAVIRRDRLKATGGEEGSTDLKPDDIVFEKGGKHSGEVVQVDAGTPLNDNELQALWLRRVQTKPADFLRQKFAFQSARNATEAKP